MKKLTILFFAIIYINAPQFLYSQNRTNGREYYQLSVYRYTEARQEKMLNDYFRDALIPALHKQGVKSVGVFNAIANDTATQKLIYVLIPGKSLSRFVEIFKKLENDKQYQQAGALYINAAYNTPAYSRMETILLQAFSYAPKLLLPQLKGPKSERVYELRSYESASEKIFKNKVHMFNEGGEVAIFKKLNFNAIFYGKVIAGGKMPNLMYMTSFENKADRDEHWKSFRDDPDWKALSAKPEYKNNVSRNEIIFLRPAEYSDF